jgi:hypothetical protein
VTLGPRRLDLQRSLGLANVLEEEASRRCAGSCAIAARERHATGNLVIHEHDIDG